jgi:hypothetical protein
MSIVRIYSMRRAVCGSSQKTDDVGPSPEQSTAAKRAKTDRAHFF